MSRLWYTLYQWHRHRLAGWPLNRWAMFLLATLGLFILLAGWPKFAVLAAFPWVTALALAGLGQWAARASFVRFSAGLGNEVLAKGTYASLVPGETLPLFVTGEVQIGGKSHPVLHAPGFVETFRNGESVVAAYSLPSRYAGLAVLPSEYEGMGYVFLPAKGLLDVTPGEIHVNGKRWPALRVTARTAEGRRVVYFAFKSLEDLGRLWRTLGG